MTIYPKIKSDKQIIIYEFQLERIAATGRNGLAREAC